MRLSEVSASSSTSSAKGAQHRAQHGLKARSRVPAYAGSRLAFPWSLSHPAHTGMHLRASLALREGRTLPWAALRKQSVHKKLSKLRSDSFPEVWRTQWVRLADISAGSWTRKGKCCSRGSQIQALGGEAQQMITKYGKGSLCCSFWRELPRAPPRVA